ncbi:hypothetical protein [Fibrella aquatilis]|uniref:Uncharacterized protein n=1 Tax=Fibrella aquatilis TaxID=2817059 RepID=A0A939K0B8_9BACT|nr:hypothetical protein [Fibrella aquatilis]MBO0934029.1 hypothetical protein [Fibrella aquatilis]
MIARLRINRQLIWVFITLLFGCKPDFVSLNPVAPLTAKPADALARIKQVVSSGDCSGLGPYYQDIVFDYDPTGRLLKDKAARETLFQKDGISQYNYDAGGQLVSRTTQYTAPTNEGAVGEIISYTITPTSIRVQNDELRADGSRLLGASNRANTVYTLVDGLITEVAYTYANGPNQTSVRTDRCIYTYTNGNITKALYTGNNQTYEYTYTYDNKPNPYFGQKTVLDPILRCSRNNVINVISVSAFGGTVYTNEFKTVYTYNEQGLPLTKKDANKGCTLTFQYEPR